CRLRIRRSIACGRRFFLAIRSAKAALPLGSFSRQMFGFKSAARRFILELVIGGGHFLKARLLACRRTLSIRMQLLCELAIGSLHLGISRAGMKPQIVIRVTQLPELSCWSRRTKCTAQ